MNLVNGKVVSEEIANQTIDHLFPLVCQTLNEGQLTLEEVITACDKLSKQITFTEHGPLLKDIGVEEYLIEEYINEAKLMLTRSYLEEKVKTELGTAKRAPLGVLFHLAAGNIDGLPVFSIIEGLLTLNINVMKLPSVEKGLSVSILLELIKIEPKLAPYIYVFDFSSADTTNLEKLAALADAIVVWGGDEVVKTVRKMASPNTKIIEWGHKISFAYVDYFDENKLRDLAKSIVKSNQLLCSSAQGIYLNTQNDEELKEFANLFLPLLEEEAKTIPLSFDLQALIGLTLYNNFLQAKDTGNQIIKGDQVSITITPNSTLETSIMYRNIWLKKLPKDLIISTLKPYKNYLQTVYLISSDDQITSLLFKAGATKIVRNGDMTRGGVGEPHDGVYPLSLYTKVITIV